MGSFNRIVSGLVVGGLSLGLVLAAGGQLWRAWSEGGPPAEVKTPRERAYAVAVDTLTAATVTPVITAYGHVSAGRSLELRSAVAGQVVALSPGLRDGGAVAAGEVLFEIDPARLETALALAETDVKEAAAELAEAEAALELARLEAAAAATQFDLRDQALARAEGLRERGVATEAEVEAAVLARAASEQALINRRQVVAGDEARVAQAGIALERREIARDEARRALADARVTAPFAGVLSGVDLALGRLVSANEQLGVLIDPAALEVSFRVTNTQFARLLNAQGALRQAEVTVAVESGRDRVELAATLERAGAEVGDGQVGRLVFARLAAPDPALVQPGDFVTVLIPEKPLDNVAQIPAAAATADGRLLLLGAGDRLEEVQATLLRQQGDTLIVADVPFGRQYVTARALQLGPGIQVQPVAAAPATGAPPAPAEAPAAAAEAPAEDTIALDDARRAALIAFVEASEKMKPEMKAKALEELNRPQVPRATVEKFEAKMAEGQ